MSLRYLAMKYFCQDKIECFINYKKNELIKKLYYQLFYWLITYGIPPYWSIISVLYFILLR